MKAWTENSRCFLNCIAIGFGVMVFALFLNPMNPDDFLALAFSDPVESVREGYGLHSALSFWISAALIAVGLIGLIASVNHRHISTSIGR